MLLTALVAAAAFLIGLRAGIAIGYRGERRRARLAAGSPQK
jgi:hypothetical protein